MLISSFRSILTVPPPDPISNTSVSMWLMVCSPTFTQPFLNGMILKKSCTGIISPYVSLRASSSLAAIHSSATQESVCQPSNSSRVGPNSVMRNRRSAWLISTCSPTRFSLRPCSRPLLTNRKKYRGTRGCSSASHSFLSHQEVRMCRSC